MTKVLSLVDGEVTNLYIYVYFLNADSPINSYTDEHEAGEVQAEGPGEHHDPAHQVAGHPLHGARPRDLQRHHQECHLQQHCCSFHLLLG